MIGSSDFEKAFYLYTCKNPEYLQNIHEGFYENEEIATLHKITKGFFGRFSQIPTRDQVKLIARQDQFKEKITESIVDLVYDEPVESYDQDWLRETSEAWILWKSLDKSLIDTIEYVKTVKVNPDNVKEVIQKVKSLINERNSISFDKDLGKNFFEAENHIPAANSKITTCHNFVDNFSGGYRTKSLVVYAGEQNVGKSIWLANDAVNYVRAGYDVAVITAEMADIDFIHRIGANLLNVKIGDYERKSKEPGFIQTRLSSLSNGVIPTGNLFVKEYPTSQVTVPEIETYLRELELTQGIKLKVIVIDYNNILANYRNPNTENTYMKIKQIAEDLRAMAVRNDWVVISATQINRSGYDSTELSLGNIAESAGLSHTADMIYGIIQDTSMHMNNEYWLKILKIRNGSGKNSRAMYRINYEYMRLAETDTVITASA
jgi:archaellum biogenesis ATPase FlaH